MTSERAMRSAPLVVVLAVTVIAGLCASCGAGPGPIHIGVMLPLTGADAVGFEAPLEWAAQNVNAAGGIDGRKIQFVYRDLGRQSAVSAAKSFVSDSSIAAVIGPDNSEDAGQVASTFVQQQKVIVSPSATSADLFRAFATQRPQYFWRPVESDISQVRTMLELVARGGAKSVALVTGNSQYGTTFFDWFGFLATELGLRVTSPIRYNEESQPCEVSMSEALAARPDALLAVPDHANQAACMARVYRSSRSRARLIFSDAAQDPSLIQSLGADAQGLEGTGLAPDPNDGFAHGFEEHFHKLPTPYAANTYDSVLLVAYGLERSGGRSGAELAAGISSVVAGRGATLGWDGPSVAATLNAIRAGRDPVVHGAVGPWNFDKTSGLELVASTYEHWRIEGNDFVPIQYVSTAASQTAAVGLSAQRQGASLAKARSGVGGAYQPRPKTGAWALLIAASDGWDNYRHQADVLAQYQLLRTKGIPADHIVVVSDNDVADNRQNPTPGVVRYMSGGPNLYRDVHVDYSLKNMTAARLMAILSGRASVDTPKVIRAGPGDDIYVYIAGHGNQNGVYLGLGEPVPASGIAYSILSPTLLDQTVAAMAAKHDYRRMLIVVEACQGAVLGESLRAPGAMLVSAASPVEDSLSANYDPSSQTWLADQFSYQLWMSESQTSDLSLEALFQQLYLKVEGSHVSVYGPNFGDPADISVDEFLTP